MGFANILRFSLGTHAGIAVPRAPDEIPTARVNHLLLSALAGFAAEELRGVPVIVELGRTRIRRPPLRKR